MSLKLKKTDVLKNYFVFSVGYCELQNLFSKDEKIEYTCGVYGWNSDIYINGGLAISSGYRPFSNVTKKQNETGRKIMKKYDKKAQKIKENFDLKANNYNYKKLYKKLDNLKNKMFDELKQILIDE